jgi:hypothetical protein
MTACARRRPSGREGTRAGSAAVAVSTARDGRDGRTDERRAARGGTASHLLLEILQRLGPHGVRAVPFLPYSRSGDSSDCRARGRAAACRSRALRLLGRRASVRAREIERSWHANKRGVPVAVTFARGRRVVCPRRAAPALERTIHVRLDIREIDGIDRSKRRPVRVLVSVRAAASARGGTRAFRAQRDARDPPHAASPHARSPRGGTHAARATRTARNAATANGAREGNRRNRTRPGAHWRRIRTRC